MRAIILAAGRGSRMKSMTSDKPKCLVELHGYTLLERQIKALRSGGVTEVGIVTGYRRELLADLGLVEFHNTRWDKTNMVASLECAAEWLEAGPCIVSYSDIFYSADAVDLLTDCQWPLCITYDPQWLELWSRRFGDPLIDAETFRVSQCGSLIEIGKKPKQVTEVQGQYMGLLRFSPPAWRACVDLLHTLAPNERDKISMTEVLQRGIELRHLKVHAIPYLGRWGEVDSDDDLAVYSRVSE